MKAGARRKVALTILLVAPTLHCARPAAKANHSWDRKTAAAYLDNREAWWMEWMGAVRDHGTFCVSCHTALPYALARSSLRSALAERGPTANELRLVDNVRKRVRLWKNEGPYYNGTGYGGKADESRGTEAVLNALILANYDAHRGQLSADSRAAFDNMWELQRNDGDKRGSWNWLQFNLEPWEAKDSSYYGASLAAIAVGTAPGDYASTSEIQGNLRLLREYLNRESANQSTLNHVFLLWASTKLPDLLNSEQQRALVTEVLSRQQSDGGWRLASIAWSWQDWNLQAFVNMWVRADGTPMDGISDGVATGLVTFVLQEARIPRDNLQLQRGLSWLANNQTAGGFWPASSVNKHRNPSSDTGRFMSDAATAYAVLSLTRSED